MSTLTTAPDPTASPSPSESRAVRAIIWGAGLLVAIAAAVATAHGLYEVALAARVPAAIAWLYPVITDGLALVAYAASARLHGPSARYAWSVVVLAAGLSGLAQAMFLASDAPPVPGAATSGEVAGPVFEASAALRFGVGAWPAIAAAIVAHLLYLLAVDHTPKPAVQAQPLNPHALQPAPPAVHTASARPVQPDPGPTVQPATPPSSRPALASAPADQPDRRPAASPARDRARAAATRHAHRHGALPTVTELEAAAQVSRGTAATVLRHLRQQPTSLHLITTSTTDDSQDDDPTVEERT